VALRRKHAALRSRDLRFLDTGRRDVLAYVRRAETPSESIVVILNFGAPACKCRTPQ